MFEVVLFAAIFCLYCHLASEWEQRHAGPTAPAEDELPQLPELMEEAAALVAKPVPAMSAPMTQPKVIAVVEVATEPDNYASLNSAQLRKRCRDAGIAWRNVRGKGKHLRKGGDARSTGLVTTLTWSCAANRTANVASSSTANSQQGSTLAKTEVW